jgi:hypothetical protein
MSDKKQLTTRLSEATMDYVAKKAESENKSLNDVMVEITEQYMQWNEAGMVLQRISMVREKVKNEVGVHSHSLNELRSLREGHR